MMVTRESLCVTVYQEARKGYYRNLFAAYYKEDDGSTNLKLILLPYTLPSPKVKGYYLNNQYT